MLVLKIMQGTYYLWVVSIVLSGQGGRFMDPLAMAAVLLIEHVFARFWTFIRSDRDKRRFIFVLGLLMTAALALGIRRLTPGMVLILAGATCNDLVMYVNGLQMPVPPDRGHLDFRHCHWNKQTRLFCLSDRIALCIAGSLAFVSIGDILIMLGWLLFSAQLWLTRWYPA